MPSMDGCMAPGLRTQQGARRPELLTCVWAVEIAATLSIASIEDGGMSSPNSAATAMAMCIEVQSLERGVAGSSAMDPTQSAVVSAGQCCSKGEGRMREEEAFSKQGLRDVAREEWGEPALSSLHLRRSLPDAGLPSCPCQSSCAVSSVTDVDAFVHAICCVIEAARDGVGGREDLREPRVVVLDEGCMSAVKEGRGPMRSSRCWGTMGEDAMESGDKGRESLRTCDEVWR
mmetsp:Transcript_24630/g.67101  ORF Transcript_24630/g.67101 Transcript_24630/m.67101 type:complete len:231 (+) Transcript_24630:334-1026(+)